MLQIFTFPEPIMLIVQFNLGEQHHQICGNTRVESNTTTKHPPHFRAAVPPARTSPTQQNVNITNGGISSVGLK